MKLQVFRFQVIAQMVLKGILQLDFGFTAYMTNTYLKASDLGLALLRSSATAGAEPQAEVFMERRAVGDETDIGAKDGESSAALPSASSSSSSTTPLMVKWKADLIAWRKHAAEEERVFPHSILPDIMVDRIVSTASLSSSSPKCLESVMNVLGPVRGQRYGARVIAVLQEGFKGESGAVERVASRGGGESGSRCAARTESPSRLLKGNRQQSVMQQMQQQQPSDDVRGPEAGSASMQGSGKHEVIELGSSDDDHGDKGDAVMTRRLGKGKRIKTG